MKAIQVVSPERRGSSCPVLIDSPRGRLFTRLRGAAQGRLALRAAVAEVPDELLDGGAPERRREASVAFLWKRLKAPRPFV